MPISGSKHYRRDDSLDGTRDDERIELIKKCDSFNSILAKVGDFGKYQWLLLLALLPYGIAYSALYFAQIFLTLVPNEHWCKVEELQNFTTEQRIKMAIPKSPDYPGYDVCQQKKLNYRQLLEGHFGPDSDIWNTDETTPCTSWEYNFTQIPYASLAVELDWVCDRAYLISSAQSIFFCGSIVGSFIFGWIADQKGRVPALILCNGICFFASIATAHTNSFSTFALCRFLTGMAFPSCVNIPMILVMEYVAVNRRTLVVNLNFGVYFAVGSTALPWIAYYMSDWRLFTYATAFPLLSCVLTPWILPESARWYMSKGKTNEVVGILKRVGEVNKKVQDPKVYENFAESSRLATVQTESATLIDLFKTPRLAKMIVLLIIFWTLVILAFDGHVYSLKLLHGSVFVSFSLASATELPAAILLTLILDRWGRRFCGFSTMIVTGVLSFTKLFLSESGYAALVVAVLARFSLNMAANVGLQHTAELLPTPVRAQGVSLIHIFGIIAHSVAPYIVDLATFWTGLPMLSLGIISIIAAIIILYLPETVGQQLSQTLEEGENFGKDQKFWILPVSNQVYGSTENVCN
ncbi:carcinine transporter-like [Athalia rosae]|uniref:carcinine transporter-like n=1 Tax=Athalia rosae TaxID=37344 RepID=UPI002033E7BE|nr:carcinine transporter-like [Athalia rosae]